MSPHLADMQKRAASFIFVVPLLLECCQNLGARVSERQAYSHSLLRHTLFQIANPFEVSRLWCFCSILEDQKSLSKLELLSISSWLSYLRLATSLRHSWGRAQISPCLGVPHFFICTNLFPEQRNFFFL